MDSHVSARGKNLPLWAAAPDTLPSSGPLTASTWTGSVYLLTWDGDSATGVHVGGRRHPGYSAVEEERKNRARSIETDLWRADPTIPRSPVLKAGEETGEVRPIRALHPSANAVQWAAEWYAVDARRGAARALEPGLVETDDTDLFTISLDGPTSACEIVHLGRIGEHSAIAQPGARTRLLSLSGLIISPLRTTFFIALNKALGDDAARPLHGKLFSAFCAEVEDILDDVIHAPTLTLDHARQFTTAGIAVFERFLTPYMNSQTVAGNGDGEGIASAIAFLHTRIAASLRRVHA